MEDVNMFFLMVFAQITGGFFGCLMANLSLYCSDESVPRTNWNVQISMQAKLLPDVGYISDANAF